LRHSNYIAFNFPSIDINRIHPLHLQVANSTLLKFRNYKNIIPFLALSYSIEVLVIGYGYCYNFSDEVFASYRFKEIIPGCLPHPGDIVESGSLAVCIQPLKYPAAYIEIIVSFTYQWVDCSICSF